MAFAKTKSMLWPHGLLGCCVSTLGQDEDAYIAQGEGIGLL